MSTASLDPTQRSLVQETSGQSETLRNFLALFRDATGRAASCKASCLFVAFDVDLKIKAAPSHGDDTGGVRCHGTITFEPP